MNGSRIGVVCLSSLLLFVAVGCMDQEAAASRMKPGQVVRLGDTRHASFTTLDKTHERSGDLELGTTFEVIEDPDSRTVVSRLVYVRAKSGRYQGESGWIARAVLLSR